MSRYIVVTETYSTQTIIRLSVFVQHELLPISLSFIIILMRKWSDLQ